MRSKVMVITGANGFLASAVIRQVNDSWRPVALVRTGTSASSDFESSHDSLMGLTSSLDSADVILHLAACIPSPFDANPKELISVNVEMVAKLVHAFPNARHVFASSVSAFGVPNSLPLSIDSPPNQPNSYGTSKLVAEKLIMQTSDYAVIRFSSLIGVGMKAGTFIPTVVTAARGGRILLRGTGERLQNYLDIEDAAHLCMSAILNKESFITLGIGDRSYSNNEVADLLAGLTGASIVREGNDDSPSYVYKLDNRFDLGPRRISLKNTLERMVNNA